METAMFFFIKEDFKSPSILMFAGIHKPDASIAHTYLLALFCLYICIILWRKTSNASSLFSSPATPKPSPAEVAPLGSKMNS